MDIAACPEERRLWRVEEDMFDPPKPDGEINSQRERRRISADASHDPDACEAPLALGERQADPGAEFPEVRLKDAAQQDAARPAPDKPEPQHTRPVLHLRKKDGPAMQQKKP